MQYWYVTDYWECYYPIPVFVKEDKGGKIIATWHLGDGITQEYTVNGMDELFADRADAEIEAAHRSAHIINRRDDNG